MGDSFKNTQFTMVGSLALTPSLNDGDSQLTFTPPNQPYNPPTYYSLAPNQTEDPALRVNQWNTTTGDFINYGYLYDSRFNLPPSTRTILAGGFGGTTNLLYSSDNGVTWFPSVSGSALLTECTSIAFNGSLWVAGGPDIIIYSSNGINWNTSASGSGYGIIYGLASNGSLWVAGSSSGLLYSYDGINWYPSTTTLVSACYGVAWNGSLWVAAGSGSKLIYSYDGITWYSSTINGSTFSQGLAVAWNGTLWLAGGQDPSGNTLAYSYDGIIWTAQSSVLTQVQAIAWSGSLWVIGGFSTTDSLLYSADGFTWTPVLDSTSLISQCYAILWTGSGWLAGGSGQNTIISSPDGINWIPVNTGTLFESACISLGINQVLPNGPITTTQPPSLLLGGSSGIAYSSDGISWEPIRPSTDLSGAICRALLWNGSLWLGGFYGTNTLGYSYDGLTWNISPNGSLALLSGCLAFATNGEISLAGGAGSNRMIYSLNGRDWLPISSADSLFDISCFTIGYNGTQWIAGSSSTTNRLIYSSDPSGTWFASASGNALFPFNCYSVAWNGAIWVATGDTIAFSSDGINWTQAATIPPNDDWRTVAYNGSLWVAGGIGATRIAYSYDGSNWSAASVPTSITQCVSVTWTGSLWIAAGGDTITAVYSYNGITWYPSTNSKLVMNFSLVVAAKQLNPTAGASLPPPVLHPESATQSGNLVYSTGLNNLYVSNFITIQDGSSRIQIQGDLSANTIHTNSLFVNDLSAITISVGTLTGSNLIAQDISTNTLGVQTLTGSNLIAQDISTNTLRVTTLTGSNLVVQDISATTLGVTTLTGSNITVQDISASTLQVWTDLSATRIHVNDMSANTISVETLNVSIFSPANITTGDLSANRVSATDISATNLNAENLYVSGIIAPNITADTLIVNVDLSANRIATDTLIVNVDLSANRIATDTLIVNVDLSANRIATDTLIVNLDLSANRIATDSLMTGIIMSNNRIDLSCSDVYVGNGQVFGNLLLRGGTAAYPICEIFPATSDSSGTLILRGTASSQGISITPTLTQISNARIINSGLLIDNGAIGPDASNPNRIVMGGTTMIQAADLSGVVRIGQGTGYGQLQIQTIGTTDYPIAVLTPIASDSSGQLGLYANPGYPGIIMRPGETDLYNPRIISGGLLISNGTIGTNSGNPNAIMISDLNTIIQNADLSGTVHIGNGDLSGALKIQSGTAGIAQIGVNIDTSGQVSIGSSIANPNAIVIGDTRTMIQNADLSGTVYIGNGDASGALQIASGATGQAVLLVNTAASGQLTLGSSAANPNAITITDANTTLRNVNFEGGLLLGNGGTIGSTVANPNAIVMSDTRTMVQNADLSGTVLIGNLTSGALQLTGSSSVSTIRPTVASGILNIGSSSNNSTAIILTDTSGTIFQNRASTAGTLYVGSPSPSDGALQISGTGSISVVCPTKASGTELRLGSSAANQTAITIDDQNTRIKNVIVSAIGASTTNRNTIVVTDTSGTIIQDRGDVSGTLSIGNLRLGALQMTGSGSVFTIRPTAASAGRLTIGSSTANPNAIVISDTSGTILQNRGDLSGTLLIGNPSRGLRITGGDTSGVAIPTGFATMRPNVSVSGCLVLGSSTLNPDAITITDTTTSIKNLSVSGGLLLGNNGTIGTTSSNASAIAITDTSGTILANNSIYVGYKTTGTSYALTITPDSIYPNLALGAFGTLTLRSSTDSNVPGIKLEDYKTTVNYLSPPGFNLGDLNTTGTFGDITNGPGQYFFTNSSGSTTTVTATIIYPGRYILYNYTPGGSGVIFILKIYYNGTPQTAYTTASITGLGTYTFDAIVAKVPGSATNWVYLTNGVASTAMGY